MKKVKTEARLNTRWLAFYRHLQYNFVYIFYFIEKDKIVL